MKRLIGSVLLLVVIVGIGGALAAWKRDAMERSAAMAANQPEPMETVVAAEARSRPHRRTTTAIGTVLALQSVTLRNELSGTVSRVDLTPGRIVEKGDLLVELDVSVELAELAAQEAQAALAETMLGRTRDAIKTNAASQTELDRAIAERDVAVAQVARTKAVIARKRILAPFRARVGISDLHAGQYLEEGAVLTTLQGVDGAVHVDFAVPQTVAATLEPGEAVSIVGFEPSQQCEGRIVAVDARVDPATRNAAVRARIDSGEHAPSPGASVRVLVPVGPPREAVIVPVSALRRGPGGDHVYILQQDAEGKTRAAMRRVVGGAMIGDDVVILDGVKVGETLAASGSFKLFDGILVNVVPADTDNAGSDHAAR